MAEDTIQVRPVEGRALPRENAPKARISEECPVPNSAYYRRALARGDIELATAPKQKAPKPSKSTDPE